MRFRLGRFAGTVAGLVLVLAAPALANQSYGAIYYSENADKEGMSWSATSEQEAEAQALQACQSNSGGATDCKFQLKFHSHLCGAFASDSNNYNSGRGDTPQAALDDATSTLNKNDPQLFTTVHCNAEAATDGAADLGAAIGGLIRALAGPAKPTPAPAPRSQPVQPVQPVQPAEPNGTYFATPAPLAPAAQTFALVGLKIYHGNVIDAIVPMYAPIGPGNVLGAEVDAPRLGSPTLGDPTVVTFPNSVITDIQAESGPYNGGTAVYRLLVGFSTVSSSGISNIQQQVAGVSGTASATLTPKELKAQPGSYFLKFNVVPYQFSNNGGPVVVVGDISVDQAKL